MNSRLTRMCNFDDAVFFARRRLPPSIFQFLEGGTAQGRTVSENSEAFDQVTLHPRPATHYQTTELSTTVVGHETSLPLLLAPMGGIRLAHQDGEAGVARAAGRAGIIQIVSGLTFTPIEEVLAAASGPVFFQLYLGGGREADQARIERVRKAGCKALVITIDAPVLAPRDRPVRSRADMPVNPGLRSALRMIPQLARHLSWTYGFVRSRMPMQASMFLDSAGKPMTLIAAAEQMGAHPPVWSDLRWIREAWPGPMIIKGLLHADDARRAIDCGADAIIVSNHGGNALDGVRPAILALPEVVRAVGKEVEVLFDGGVRRANDLVKALALGARAVLLGRAYAWPFAAAGEHGISRILDLFKTDLKTTLALMGCPAVSALESSYVSLRCGCCMR